MRNLLFLLLYTSALFVSAQSKWNFGHISTKQGLSTGTVNCTFKDSKGYVWFGTLDGLNRYDGYEMKLFKSDKSDPTSLAGNIITSIDEDSQGNIWIGTRNNGISIFDWRTGRFQNILVNGPEGLPSGSIQKILVTDEDDLLIGLLGGGLCKYNSEEGSIKVHTASNKPSSISNNNVFSIAKAKPNHYWIGNHRGGIDLFNSKTETFQRYTYDPRFSSEETIRQDLLVGKDGTIWIGTDGEGLIKFNVTTSSFNEYKIGSSGLSSNIIKTVYEDQNGFIYVGTDGGGINILDPTTNQFSYLASDLYDDESLSSDAIYNIYEDEAGIIWVSTFRGGVNYFSKHLSKFHHYEQLPNEKNSLSFNSVIALEESSKGEIWIGTDGGGLDRLNPNTGEFEHFKSTDDPRTISTNVPISLLEDSDGYLWAGTYAGGVNRFNPVTNQFTRFVPDPNNPNSINSLNVWDILEDHQQKLWFALLDGGLASFDKDSESFTHYVAAGNKGSLSSNLVITLFEDSKRNFWVGTEDAGLNLFDRNAKTFKVFRNDPSDINSLLNDNIRTLHEDRNGKLWIGTAEGMNEMDLQTMEIKPSQVNFLLPNLVINGILEDKKGNLWISTNQGLSKYNPETAEIQNFTIADGLQGNEFNYTASLKARDGRMYFGGIHGLNDFHPDEVRLSSVDPQIAITAIRLFDEPITEIMKRNGDPLVSSTLPYLEELELSHDQNVLEISFASLDYTSPNSNTYKYQLEGFDQSWVYVDAKKRSANYTNLDAGTYVFKVTGTNSDGVWATSERAFTLSILPPWWATWWFRLLVLVLIITIAWGTYRWRSTLIKQQKRDLEARVAAATSQVVEQNKVLQEEQENLTGAIQDINFVIAEAVESGNFTARIDTDSKSGQWKVLGDSVNELFESIVTPFNAINEVVNAMAESNLSIRYSGEAKGDVKLITDNLNHALNQLSNLLSDIVSNTEVIGSSSEEMMISSEEMNISTNEIASAISEMSSGAQNQVQRIDEASQIIENILSYSSEATKQAEIINHAAEKGVELSDSGKGFITKMDTSMKKMLEVSVQTNASIEVLSDRSDEISKVLNIIKDISEQTNMLALNAAIEAAKAGDSGRGFSVVAEQIRKLAEDSASSTTKIERMVEEVQESISSTRKLINEMSSDIQVGVEASDQATHSFGELANSYSKTFDLSEQIVGATKDQNLSVRQVVELMEGVVVIAEQTAAGTEEAASSSQELSSGMTEYANRTKSVGEIVTKLQEKLSQFVLNNTSSTTTGNKMGDEE